MDTIVLDIETQNFFTDPEVGWGNFGALKISVVCLYSYGRDQYVCFEEGEIKALAQLVRESGRLVGFSINRYDLPVLHHYFRREVKPALDLWQKERVDLLEEIEIATGHRVSLDKLARANLSGGKERHGAEAISLYREGRLTELKEYCRHDVRLTKELYDLYRERNYLFVPDRLTGTLDKVLFQA